jgi:dsDNA-specific endonuclease/ATPase MutS2
MTFAPGDRVHVAGIGTGTVREARNGGRYLVEIKGRTLVVQGTQVEPAASPKPSRRSKSHDPQPATIHSAAAPRGCASLDLHGKTVLEAVEALDVFLNDTLLDGHREARVIHGRSGGRIRAAVHQRLAALPSVQSFRLDPDNPGVTIVEL